MSLFSVKEYLRYRIKARGRHGTHSPFVYAFVEDILRGRALIGPSSIDPFPGYPHNDLLRRIAAYYHYNSVLQLQPADTLTGALGHYDIIITPSIPADWQQQSINSLPLLADGGMLLFPTIHSTPYHAEAWQTIQSLPQVMMSIDMFHTGFIFKSSSFLRKQHFVIK